MEIVYVFGALAAATGFLSVIWQFKVMEERCARLSRQIGTLDSINNRLLTRLTCIEEQLPKRTTINVEPGRVWLWKTPRAKVSAVLSDLLDATGYKIEYRPDLKKEWELVKAKK